MNGSGKILVVKADRSVEDFDKRKLAGSIWRSMSGKYFCYGHAEKLAEAIQSYIQRKPMTIVTSAAVFEMAIKALRCRRSLSGLAQRPARTGMRKT